MRCALAVSSRPMPVCRWSDCTRSRINNIGRGPSPVVNDTAGRGADDEDAYNYRYFASRRAYPPPSSESDWLRATVSRAPGRGIPTTEVVRRLLTLVERPARVVTRATANGRARRRGDSIGRRRAFYRVCCCVRYRGVPLYARARAVRGSDETQKRVRLPTKIPFFSERLLQSISSLPTHSRLVGDFIFVPSKISRMSSRPSTDSSDAFQNDHGFSEESVGERRKSEWKIRLHDRRIIRSFRTPRNSTFRGTSHN